jgi:hypothetical protein
MNCEALRLAREKYVEIPEIRKNRGITQPKMNRPKIVNPRLGVKFIISQGK